MQCNFPMQYTRELVVLRDVLPSRLVCDDFELSKLLKLFQRSGFPEIAHQVHKSAVSGLLAA